MGSNGLESDRDSFHIKLTKPHAGDSRWGAAFTYTYSDATENRQFGETFSLDYPTINGFGTNPSSGVSDHVIVANVTYDLPYDIKLASKLTLKSAAPFSGTDCTAGWNDCVFRTGYQNESKFILADWAYRQIDLSLSKDFNITGSGDMYIRLDVLNVLNTENFGVSDTWFGAPDEPNANVGASFGRIVGPTRTLKLSIGYNF